MISLTLKNVYSISRVGYIFSLQIFNDRTLIYSFTFVKSFFYMLLEPSFVACNITVIQLNVENINVRLTHRRFWLKLTRNNTSMSFSKNSTRNIKFFFFYFYIPYSKWQLIYALFVFYTRMITGENRFWRVTMN